MLRCHHIVRILPLILMVTGLANQENPLSVDCSIQCTFHIVTYQFIHMRGRSVLHTLPLFSPRTFSVTVLERLTWMKSQWNWKRKWRFEDCNTTLETVLEILFYVIMLLLIFWYIISAVISSCYAFQTLLSTGLQSRIAIAVRHIYCLLNNKLILSVYRNKTRNQGRSVPSSYA